MSGLTVVKVGGSLRADPIRLRALLTSITDGAFGPCLVVPGGGAYADAVRLDQARLGFDDAEAHCRALDAMSRMAADFHAIEPRLLPSPLCGGPDSKISGHLPVMRISLPPLRGRVARELSRERGATVPDTALPSPDPRSREAHPPPQRGEGKRAGESRTPIWDPAALRAGHPDIPETWDMTSDSLALWVAAQVRAARCLLVKSADAPAGADARDLARMGLVDAAFPAFAARFGGPIAILGPAGETPVPVRDAA